MSGYTKPVVGINYLVYTALISQTGTSAPTAIILENTIGSISFIYSAVGLYILNSSSLFTVDKTWSVLNGYGNNIGNYISAIEMSDISNITIRTSLDGTGFNAILDKTPIEIRVYP